MKTVTASYPDLILTVWLSLKIFINTLLPHLLEIPPSFFYFLTNQSLLFPSETSIDDSLEARNFYNKKLRLKSFNII